MGNDSGPPENVVVLAAEIHEGELLCRVARQAGFQCAVCRSIHDFCDAVCADNTGVGVLTQEVLTQPNTDMLIRALRRQPAWSELPLIVIGRGGTLPAAAIPKVLSDLRSLRAAVVLERPLRILTLASALQMALRERRRQYEQRAATEKAELLRRLQTEHERLEFAQTAGNVGVFEWHLGEDRLIVSPQLESIWGLAPGAYDGTRGSFWASVDPRDTRRMQKEMLHMLRERGGFDIEFRILRPDGSVRWIYSRAQLLGDPPRRIIGINMDITERKQAEDALREAQKRESIITLAGGVAHDFNNLLTGILGNASIAQELLPAGHPVRPFIQRITTAADTASGLTRQLVAYSGKGRVVVQDVDVSELIAGMSGLLRSALPRTVDLRLDLPRGLPGLKADRSQIEQIVLNTAINAGEAIGADRAGMVEIRTLSHKRADGSQVVCIEVRDNGPGMSDEVKARIFEPFFSTKFLGRGLGLAAVAGIVRSYKGDIAVDSRPGQGATFHICLPAHAQPAAAAPAETQQVAGITGRGTVLIADDEEVVRELLGAIFERYGFSVLLAQNGKEALAGYDRHARDITLVVLDLIMPVMSGEETLAELHRRDPELPVLVSTADPEADVERLSPLHDRLDVLQKPFSVAQLTERVRSLLERGMTRRA